MPILSLQDVSKDYLTDGQPVHALTDLSLNAERGEFVALAGRSGCGKSTLLNLAGAMDFPTSGKVLVDGVSTSSLNDSGLTQLRREKVGFIFQSFQLLHTLTVFENVELPLLLAGKRNPREAVRERLAWVELEGLGDRYPHQLSGGQMQRVAIARALIHSPSILLAGKSDLEIVASGGVPENVVGTLVTLPYSIRVSPRIEDYAVIADTKKPLPLIGLDLVSEGSAYAQSESQNTGAPPTQSASENVFEHLGDADSIWVGSSVGYKIGDRVELLINDQVHNYTVRGVYPDSNGNEAAIVMDLAAAQHALARYERVDRILLKVPKTPSLEDWQQRLRVVLPAGVEVRPQGTGTNENRRMLAAFRWNLRLLSYISLIVGAFLIYNTISVSVVP